MAEEAALKKQLETCEDFVERREIRKKLRELRLKKTEDPDPEPSGRSTRKEVYTEEITTKSSDGVTVTETHKTKTEIIENGDVMTSEETVEESSKVDGGEPEIDNVELDQEEEQVEEQAEEQQDEKPQEEEPEEPEEEPPQEEEEENVAPYMQKNPETLTEQDIEEIDDIEFLETTLNKLSMKFFDVRKYLRARIRKVKVNQGKAGNRQGQVARSRGKMFESKTKDECIPTKAEQSNIKKNNVSSRTKKFEEDNSRKMEKSLSDDSGNSRDGHVEIKENGHGHHGDSDVTDDSEKTSPKNHEEFTIEQFANDTLLNRLDDHGITQDAKKDPQVYEAHSEDEDGSSFSSPSATSSTSDMENPTSITTNDSGNTKNTSSAPAHRLDPLEPGKKKTDFLSQLKKTGLSPRVDIGAVKRASSLGKKDKPEALEFRKNLKSVAGAVPLMRRGSWSEKYGPSLRDKPSKRTEEEPTRRKISSSDLFNLVNKPSEPAETNTEEPQRRPSQTYKYEPPKIVEPKDENFETVMAQRKKSSSRQFSPADIKSKSTSRRAPTWSPKQLRKATYVPPMPGARKLSVGNEVTTDVKDGLDLPDEDIDAMLKDVDVENLEDIDIDERQVSPRPTRKMSGTIKWVQGPQINIEDKNQLSALRQQIEQQKKQQEGGGRSYSSTTSKTTEIHRDGSGGSSTFTKTTTTTTRGGSAGGIGGRGGVRNFEAEMSKKKKERQAAKAQAFKSAKDKRSAFKDQLEAASPKPTGGVKKSFSQPNTAVNALLEWCRRKTRGYENVEIQNYTTSWADGLAMCALFHNFSPDLVPWETLNPKDRKRNWTLAFDAAYKEGMDPLLELEDVLCTPVPEPRSLITYIHSIYQHFHDKAEKAKAEAAQNA